MFKWTVIVPLEGMAFQDMAYKSISDPSPFTNIFVFRKFPIPIFVDDQDHCTAVVNTQFCLQRLPMGLLNFVVSGPNIFKLGSWTFSQEQ